MFTDADTGFGKTLSQEAQNQLGLAKTIFESLSDSVQNGTASVGQLKLISEGRCIQQFIDLYKIMTSAKQGSNVDQKQLSRDDRKAQTERNTRDILRLLNTRKKELEALQHQIDLNKTLVSVCNTIPQGINILVIEITCQNNKVVGWLTCNSVRF